MELLKTRFKSEFEICFGSEIMNFVEVYADEYLYIGLNDLRQEGRFEWLDGTPYEETNLSYGFRWDKNQPDNWYNEDCVTFKKTKHGKYNDIGCFDQYPGRGLCEITHYPEEGK